MQPVPPRPRIFSKENRSEPSRDSSVGFSISNLNNAIGSEESLGFWGIIIGYLIIAAHLCTLNSFGIPYVYSLTSKNLKKIDDILIRKPLWIKNDKTLFRRKNKYKN